MWSDAWPDLMANPRLDSVLSPRYCLAKSSEFDAGDFDVHLFDCAISIFCTESPRYCLTQREDAQAFDVRSNG